MSVVREAGAKELGSARVCDTFLWHSQAHMPSVRAAEIVLARGEGAYVWDERGHRLLDAPASLWYCNVGHGRAEIADAVAEQMRVITDGTLQISPPFVVDEADLHFLVETIGDALDA